MGVTGSRAGPWADGYWLYIFPLVSTNHPLDHPILALTEFPGEDHRFLPHLLTRVLTAQAGAPQNTELSSVDQNELALWPPLFPRRASPQGRGRWLSPGPYLASTKA